MMISREATMLSSRLAVLLSAFYHRLIIAHEASSFHCDGIGQRRKMTSLTPFRNVCPVTTVGSCWRVMKYQVKEFINEKYSKAVNILKDNLKEHYHILWFEIK
ncbi:hypothetical protein [Klebsiella pneumoniae]|uniref:hypothetical protein n=1 Tax=Klebsiella pneumoniae TaxID=573 RepID=UPI000F1BC871|nr:hypothetical protein [Klebsiella pneumoniae]VCV94264.1 hypothetical protein BANRA_05675 [Klebsiella pneumoniae]